MIVAAPVQIRALAQGVLCALFLCKFTADETCQRFFYAKKERVDDMGGRGSMSGARKNNNYMGMYSGLDYGGFRNRVEQLENALDRARSLNTINVVAIASQKLISSIDLELKSPMDPDENAARLRAYKYRAQKLFEKAKQKYMK